MLALVMTHALNPVNDKPDTGDESVVNSTNYKAEGVSFTSCAWRGLTFPTGVNDDGRATVSHTFQIADTETSYELWEKVYQWATSGSGGAPGDGQYFFANVGTQGDGSPEDTKEHPVTMINWRDSIVWCNALTEWYNANAGTDYDCVYTYSNTIIRDSRDSNAAACDGVAASSTANGFRLLTSDEYECAARYRDGTRWTYGDHASGDDSGACYDDGDILGGQELSEVFGNYAWYSRN